MRVGSWPKWFAKAATHTAAVIMLASLPAGRSQAAHIKTIYAFCSLADCADGLGPGGGLVRDASGDLYGLTQSDHQGVAMAYRLTREGTSWRLETIHTFCVLPDCVFGESARGPLIIDVNGNLYGTTQSGGAHNSGTAFELSPNAGRTAWTLKVLYDFCAQTQCADGVGAATGLTYRGEAAGVPYDGISPLYGVTSQGGAHNSGTAFQLVRSESGTWAESVVYSFCSVGDCSDGNDPAGGLIVDGNGNLFGVTAQGGDRNKGTVFEFSAQGQQWIYTRLYSFCVLTGCHDGNFPVAKLYQDAQGTLYGTTYDGGAQRSGALFKLVPDGVNSQETVLYSFCRKKKKNCADGAAPSDGVTMDAQGNILGGTGSGGSQFEGVFFELNNRLRLLHTFCTAADCTDGGQPIGVPLLDAGGNIFGAAAVGGANHHGVVFELKP